ISVTVALWGPWRSLPRAEVVRFEISPPPNTTFQNPGWPILSPDGRRIAVLTGSSPDANRLWIRDLDVLQFQSLPAAEAGFPMAWSPDSRSIVSSLQNPVLRIFKINIAGGPPQTLCEIDRQSQGGGNGPPSAAWSREGVILFVGRSGL